MKSIYSIPLMSAEEVPDFLDQFKGKASMVVNTTVGCGNANQMEVLQMLQDKYGGEDFQIIAIPTNDYCGPGITYGKWSEGITCGADSANYGKDVYGTTFKFSEMIASNPNKMVNDLSEHKGNLDVNGLGQPKQPPHELYHEIKSQMSKLQEKEMELGILVKGKYKQDYYSWWLNLDTAGEEQSGNFEKYLVDKDGYVARWFQCTVLNYDVEKTVKDAAEANGQIVNLGPGRSLKIFQEEYETVCKEIEELIAGKKSLINPNS
jgi:glutathione peroxidase-family protein